MPTSRDVSEFVRLTSAARYLNVTPITVRYWIRWGWLNAYTIGPQSFRIKIADLKLLKRRALELEEDVAGQLDTRYGVILRDSRELFGTFLNKRN